MASAVAQAYDKGLGGRLQRGPKDMSPWSRGQREVLWSWKHLIIGAFKSGRKIGEWIHILQTNSKSQSDCGQYRVVIKWLFHTRSITRNVRRLQLTTVQLLQQFAKCLFIIVLEA